MTVEPALPDQWLIVYGKAIEDVLRRAVHQALLVHKRAGNPIATWQDEHVVIIPPEDIPVEDVLAH
jgi:hypothetical protein